MILDESEWEVVDKPKQLRQMIEDRYGIEPEASIRHRGTGKTLFFEVKKQKGGGNADERACKHHTVQFYKTMQKRFGYDYHPFVTIMCENLAVDDRYVLKHPTYFEDGQYFLWKDYDLDSLEDYLLDTIDRFNMESE